MNDAFTDLKMSLALLPVLAYPDFNRPFSFETDASSRAVGAVLAPKVTSPVVRPQDDERSGETVRNM